MPVLEPSELLKIVEVEDRLRNIKCYWGEYYTHPHQVEADLRYYMHTHRLAFLRETARYHIHPDDVRRFDCTLDILSRIEPYADHKLRRLLESYEAEVRRLRENFSKRWVRNWLSNSKTNYNFFSSSATF
jgi:hypothetical protein